MSTDSVVALMWLVPGPRIARALQGRGKQRLVAGIPG